MSFLHWLQQLDERLFIIIHHDGGISFLDNFMLLMRNPITWIPLYAFMLFWAIKYGKPYTVAFVACTLITFALGDFISSRIIKNLVERTRPCDTESIRPYLRNLIGCGGFSFPSSHATNHFALATFWYLSIKNLKLQKWHWLWFWAALISYAQIYVGKHYPLDILAGTILGISIGLFTYKLFSYIKKKQQRKNTIKV